MALSYLLATFLLLGVEANVFPNCGRKFDCRSLFMIKHRVDGMFGKLEELSETQYRLRKIEKRLISRDEDISTCTNNAREAKDAFFQLSSELGDFDSLKVYNQSLNRLRDTNDVLEGKLGRLEEQLRTRLNVGQKLKDLEIAEKTQLDRIGEIRTVVDDLGRTSREGLDNLRELVETKVNKTELLQFKSDVYTKIQGLQRSLNGVKVMEKNFGVQKNKIVQQQNKSIKDLSELKQTIQELSNELETMKREQDEKFSKLEGTISDLEKTSKKNRASPTDNIGTDWFSALDKGTKLLNETGGGPVSSISTSRKSEETFSLQSKP